MVRRRKLLNKSLVAVVGVVAAVAVAVAWSGKMGPGQMEQGAGQDSGPIASVILPTSFSDDAKIGNRIFDAKCAACHGTNAAGKDGVAPPLIHKYYEPNHHGDEAFQIAAARGVQSHHWNFGNMPPVEGVTRADIKMVVAYVREVQRANGIQ